MLLNEHNQCSGIYVLSFGAQQRTTPYHLILPDTETQQSNRQPLKTGLADSAVAEMANKTYQLHLRLSQLTLFQHYHLYLLVILLLIEDFIGIIFKLIRISFSMKVNFQFQVYSYVACISPTESSPKLLNLVIINLVLPSFYRKLTLKKFCMI